MNFDIDYDEYHQPIYVRTDDGFAQTGRAFDKDTDSWMLSQLNPADFPGIGIGRETEWLVNQVNKLRRENYELKQDLDMWKKSVGML